MKGEKEVQMTENGMTKSWNPHSPFSGSCKMLDIHSLPCFGNCSISMICVSINTLCADVEKMVLIDFPENLHVFNCTCCFSLSCLVL